jgi:hypothetical protein
MWTGKQPVDRALARRGYSPDEAILTPIYSLNIELLSRLDTI